MKKKSIVQHNLFLYHLIAIFRKKFTINCCRNKIIRNKIDIGLILSKNITPEIRTYGFRRNALKDAISSFIPVLTVRRCEHQ